jgi:hypothetical protein
VLRRTSLFGLPFSEVVKNPSKLCKKKQNGRDDNKTEKQKHQANEPRLILAIGDDWRQLETLATPREINNASLGLDCA